MKWAARPRYTDCRGPHSSIHSGRRPMLKRRRSDKHRVVFPRGPVPGRSGGRCPRVRSPTEVTAIGQPLGVIEPHAYACRSVFAELRCGLAKTGPLYGTGSPYTMPRAASVPTGSLRFACRPDGHCLVVPRRAKPPWPCWRPRARAVAVRAPGPTPPRVSKSSISARTRKAGCPARSVIANPQSARRRACYRQRHGHARSWFLPGTR